MRTDLFEKKKNIVKAVASTAAPIIVQALLYLDIHVHSEPKE